jgi:hypothetical protein
MAVRTADYTIQGFLYQFNKSLVELLKSQDESVVTVEGVVEDLEVIESDIVKAIQCKYHESKSGFDLSDIYKPVLQMLDNFHDNTDKRIEYVLFCHFPEKVGDPELSLTKDQINEILNTTNKQFQKYISKLKNKVDIDLFLTKFKIEFGESLPNLEMEAKNLLKDRGWSQDDVDYIFYPNAFHTIATISTKHNEEDRKIIKQDFIHNLSLIKSTIVSKWTLSLQSYKKVLEAKRKQLKSNLGVNTRLRYLLLHRSSINDFDKEIVSFIKSFLDKYHFKSAHIKTPLFCIDCPKDVFDKIRIRIHQKGIRVGDGFVSDYFDQNYFLREPLSTFPKNKEPEREFDIRLIRYGNDKALDIINNNKCDDIFVVSNCEYQEIETQDVSCELLQLNSLLELEYLLRLKDSYE